MRWRDNRGARFWIARTQFYPDIFGVRRPRGKRNIKCCGLLMYTGDDRGILPIDCVVSIGLL